jgi:hypothetical protein
VWDKEGLRPRNMPANPDTFYKDDGWQGWGHWLDTGRVARSTEFLPFEDALQAARALRLNTSKEWRAWCRTGARPANVPSDPPKVYENHGWQGWVHWLYHADLEAARAPSSARPAVKRAASSAEPSGPSKGKRQRR